MGNYRDHRQPRRQGLENDGQRESTEPSYFDRRPPARAPSAAETSPACDAEVAWFNGEKGFGFLKLSDGSDAFIHLSKLRAAGHERLPEAARLRVRTELGQKGLQVVEVISVEVVAGSAQKRPATESVTTPAGELEGSGVVKRYDSIKGFGFIQLDGGGEDVFVHATTLARNGVAALDAGQKVHLGYSRGQKGLEARTIRPL